MLGRFQRKEFMVRQRWRKKGLPDEPPRIAADFARRRGLAAPSCRPHPGDGRQGLGLGVAGSPVLRQPPRQDGRVAANDRTGAPPGALAAGPDVDDGMPTARRYVAWPRGWLRGCGATGLLG
ncbi:hypothetical protein Veis_4014 [Verminephrobacter eiseniae EF01-2]|uniref:Uncharacterized protein n=1 Tax=Verminephrobacter eiseniae (strain EF01-2) TaxID=391735 RepID=A1WQ12_VEREI|nr:hypothetical protein Veis_4014 [Verminephrobacter eiseniae EF01-2]